MSGLFVHNSGEIMARKKRTTVGNTDTDGTTSAVTVAEPKAPATQPEAKRPDYIDGPPVSESGNVVKSAESPERQTNWGDPYKRIFSSNEKGFEMGENRRFKQRVFLFNERPEQSILDTLKDCGFTYRPAEKAWTIPANPDTRRLSEELAHEFAGEARGLRR
jgi:hypothetical protein